MTPEDDAVPDPGPLDDHASHALLEAITAIASDLDLASILLRIVEAATSLTDAQYGALGVIGPDGGLVEFVTTGIDEKIAAAIGHYPLGKGLLGVIIDDPDALRLEDISAHPKSVGFPPNHPPMTTFLGMPVRIRGTAFGNIYLTEKRGGRQFTETDERLVEALAKTAGFVIGNARAYAQSERRRQWLEAAADLGEALQPPVDIDHALQRIVTIASAVAGARAVALWSSDGPGHDTIFGDAGPEDMASVRARVQLASTGQVVTTPVGATTAVVVPLRSHLSAVHALVAFADHDAALLDVEERELFAAFADQAALSLDRAQALADRAELAVISDRERIARDLHDIVIQRLFATGLQLQGVAATADPRVAARLGDAVSDLDATIKAIRGTIFELQERQVDSLRAEVRALVKEYVPILGFTPGVRTSGPIDTAVTRDVGQQLLAVLREAVSNVARHSLADRADIDVVLAGGFLELRVVDDGVGVPGEVHESGLRNARRRAQDLGGSLEISPGPERGTRLIWRVPVD